MLRNINRGLTVFRLMSLCQVGLTSMVLPRPPSSPNEIPREIVRDNNGKFQNEKAIYSLLQLNTNVEKPNTDGYRLLEIELGGGSEMDERNLRGLVQAMLSSSENEDPPETYAGGETRNQGETYPNPEVIPNSILGVREIGLSPNYRINPLKNEREEEEEEEDKRTNLRSRVDSIAEDKLYYLKKRGPKVDVKVRGHSGSFTSDEIISKTSNDRFSMILPTGSDDGKTKSLLEKKNRRPKKYRVSTVDDNEENGKLTSERIFGTGEYEPRPDKASDESTTENMSVTSSELPKQIPAPPSRFPNYSFVAQTTPVQKYFLRRSDILPGYGYGEV